MIDMIVHQDMKAENDCNQDTVKVLFFGAIAEKMGKRSLDMQPGTSLAEVMKEIGCEGFSPFLVAVNQVQVNDMSVLVNAGDEIAIMPPFSGG